MSKAMSLLPYSFIQSLEDGLTKSFGNAVQDHEALLEFFLLVLHQADMKGQNTNVPS